MKNIFILILTVAALTSCTARRKTAESSENITRLDSTVTTAATITTTETIDTVVTVAGRSDSVLIDPVKVDSLIQVIIDNDRQRVTLSKDKASGKLKVNAVVKPTQHTIQKKVEKVEQVKSKSRVKSYEKNEASESKDVKFKMPAWFWWLLIFLVILFLMWKYRIIP
jgi:ABC-type Na+ efflux pump permease subunit